MIANHSIIKSLFSPYYIGIGIEIEIESRHNEIESQIFHNYNTLKNAKKKRLHKRYKMPSSFNVVSQDEREGLDFDNNEVNVVQSGNRFCKYTHLTPKVKKILLGSVAALVLIVGISSLGGGSGEKRGGLGSRASRGSWPAPEVKEDDYAKNKLSTNHAPVSIVMDLGDGTSYVQSTKMTTSTKIDFGKEEFAETVHMNTEDELDVDVWYNENAEVEGYKIDVTFTKVAVTSEDSGGDFTYYNSLAENGDSNFDAVLETMIGETVTVDLDSDYHIISEEDKQNALEEMEQEYSLGTTTGLSAMDQVGQITNILAYLPNSDAQHNVGDTWDIKFSTDIQFTGTSGLSGFITYNGFDCAVIKSTSNVDTSYDTQIGDDILGTLLEVESGSIDTVIYWDVTYNIPRYLKTVIEMKSDIDEVESVGGVETDDKDEVLVPMKETIEMYFAPF